MKAISVRQPWASLIVNGVKDIENRTWPCPKKYIGQRILIQASSTGGKKFKVNLTDEQMMVAIDVVFNEAISEDMPFGAIIGSVEIVDCVVNHSSIWAEKTNPESMGVYQHGIPNYHVQKSKDIIYNWVLANPIFFEKPIACKGRLGFFDVEL